MPKGSFSVERRVAMAFVIAFITLLTQVLVHRLVSAKLLNNYAFLVISLTMLGFAFSGVILSRWRAFFLDSWQETTAASAALFVITLLGSSAAFCLSGAWPQVVTSRPEFLRGFFLSVPLALLFAAPFTLCGLMLGTFLSSRDLPVARVYAFDLLGSALGALAAIPVIKSVGVERGLVAAAAFLLLASLAIVPPRAARTWVLCGTAAACVLTAGIAPEHWFRIRYPADSLLYYTQQPGSGYTLEYAAWDPVARIEVSRIRTPNPKIDPYPVLTGENPDLLRRFELGFTQNNFAGTMALRYDGTRESLAGIEETIYGAAYQTSSVRAPQVAIIGVGGGFDVINALYYGASRVLAIEINGATVDILSRVYLDYFKAWVQDPRVTLVHGDGRSVLETTPGPFDVIQISGVDSFSGAPAAAHIFAESYIYTGEAFDTYLARLSDQGIINMMRFEYPVAREMLRALATAVAALRRAGVERPSEHIVTLTATNGRFTALLVKKTPFTPAETDRLWQWASKSPLFTVSAGQGFQALQMHPYAAFLAQGTAARERLFLELYPFNVAPVDDNRPFFFRHSYWSHLWPRSRAIEESIPVMEYSLLLLLLLVGLLTLVLVGLPLRWLARIEGVRASPRQGAFFAIIALGYMAIEIALLQKFALFLGHPNYALSVVLAVLLLTTGAGALLSTRLARSSREIRFASYAVAFLVLGEYLLVFPRLPGWVGWPFGAKVALVFLMITPLGVALGIFMPWGLERLRGSAALIPWAWGVNGIFSVIGPILAVGASMTWGVNALLLCAVFVYLAAGISSSAVRTA